MRGSPTWLKIGLPILVAAALAAGLAAMSELAGDGRIDTVDGSTVIAEANDGGVDAAIVTAEPQDAGAPDAAWRLDRRGRLVRAPDDRTIVCRQPRLPIPRSEGCDAGRPYPECRWQLPEPAAEEHVIWRNTTDDHRWGRPGLVSLILASSAEYRRRWPGERVVIGDLDAPGPRHQTHDRGVDVDLYLPDSMIARSAGAGRYPDNYEGRPRREVDSMRARVMDLAKILAVCANGQIRIYYNDPDLIGPFRAWFDERGFASEVGLPMLEHNDLHRFHFHITVPETIEPLPPR